MKTITQKEMLAIIRQKAEDYGTQRVLARELGISAMYLSDILNGHREVSDAVAKKLGYTLVKMYEKVPDVQD